MDKKIIQPGSRVIYRSSFGAGNKQEATVNKITDNNGIVDSVDWENKNDCRFSLSNGRTCFGSQIDDLADIEVRIVFRSEIFIKGKNIEEVKEKWENLELFSCDALDDYAAYLDLESAEDGQGDITEKFD